MIEVMRRLGIDYGERNLGLAISAGGLAEPLGVIKRESGRNYWEELVELVKKNAIEEVIFGLPEGRGGEKVMRFGGKLGELAGVKVDYQDETLSTKDAKRKAIEAGKSRRTRREKEHAFAAAVILQEYLDKL